MNERNEEDVTLKQFILKLQFWFNFLLQERRKIMLVTLISAFLGLTSAYFELPKYKAVSTFAMEEDKGSGGGLGGALGLASSFGIDLGGAGSGGAFAASNIAELMKSHFIVEKVLLKNTIIKGESITLAEYYILINNYKEKWRNKPDLQIISFPQNLERSKCSRLQDSVLKVFYKKLTSDQNLSIQQKDKKVSIINIEVTSEDEIFSKLFCEGLAMETSEFYINTKSKKARINTQILQKQVDSVREELNLNINLVAQSTDNVYNLNPSLNIKGAASKRKQIDITANSEVLKQIVVQLELSKINLRKETPLIQIIDQPSFPLEKIRFGYLKSFLLACFLGFLAISFFLIYIKMYSELMK